MKDDKVITSAVLKEETEREFGIKIKEVNPKAGGASNYAAQDKSYSTAFDALIKAIRGKDKKDK